MLVTHLLSTPKTLKPSLLLLMPMAQPGCCSSCSARACLGWGAAGCVGCCAGWHARLEDVERPLRHLVYVEEATQ